MQRPRTIAHGIELFPARTPTLPPATHTNSYALGEREVLLVEPATPYEDERRAWLAWAKAIATAGRTLVAIFVTHHHPDHVGGVAAFADALGLPIWAHAATAERLANVPVARALADGEAIDLAGPMPQRWSVLHTPGHAPGHLCLHEPTMRALVVGDMVASEGTILIEPTEGDMAEYLRQLERLARLDAELALPAHGDPIDGPTALFERYIAHRLMRERKVLAALARVGEAGADASDLVPTVYDDTSPTMWAFAQMSLVAHLLKLEREGRARRIDGRWGAASS